VIKKIQTLLTTAVLLFGMGSSSFADFNDGFDAYNKGDYKTAFNEWKPLAERGHTGAQNNLGSMYDNGRGVLKDYQEAVRWYKKAAEQGDAFAQNNLGWMYINGRGVVKDLNKAKYWIKKAYESPAVRFSIKELTEEDWRKLEL
jgi:uncharacterized protein